LVAAAQGALENGRRQTHILAMEAFTKIALLAALAVLTFGVIPDRRRGAVIAVGTCVVAALVLHFAAP
jgi:uncharacterized RDD family membrane protein YckC